MVIVQVSDDEVLDYTAWGYWLTTIWGVALYNAMFCKRTAAESKGLYFKDQEGGLASSHHVLTAAQLCCVPVSFHIRKVIKLIALNQCCISYV